MAHLKIKLARYLLKRDELATKTVEMFDAPRDKTNRDRLIADLGQMHADLEAEAAPLQDELARYRARLAEAASQDGEPPTNTAAEPPKPRRTRRPNK